LTTVPARIAWAVDLLDPRPDERVLEAGCGPGVAAQLIGARLTTGRLLAVDRSATAVQRTAARVAGLPVDVRQADLAAIGAEPAFTEAGFAEAAFDAAFTVNVNVFWTRPDGPELGVLARALRPGGRLLILYGAGGPTTAARVTGPIAAGMTALGLDDVRVVRGERGVGVVGRRPG
jgi:SAM-dependent methyltransferase